ncbi:hypothetical protein AHF37_06614 [Paragonimus kellicotti]|nr:hypothetical protein AHF37_06614 [Paragonimus kellicotti]
MSEAPNWRAEACEKRRQREREIDVERRWQKVMDRDGEGAPEWLKEAALRKKAMQTKDSDVPPWMKEVKLINKELARKITEADQPGKSDARTADAGQSAE